MRSQVIKSPLRYPGGKSRATKKLATLFPTEFSSFVEPMVGGGSVSFFVSQNYDVPVWVNDAQTPLTNFWKAVAEDSETLANDALALRKYYFDKTKEDRKAHFQFCKKNAEDPLNFFYLNRTSYSGLGVAGVYFDPTIEGSFTEASCERLRQAGQVVKDWKITNLDFTECLTDDPDAFIYLDPPYKIDSNLYGKDGEIHKHFHHDGFRKSVGDLKSKVMVSYNAEVEWDDWNSYVFPLTYCFRGEHKYSKAQEKRREVVFRNYD